MESNSQQIINKIFSNDYFKHIDQNKIIGKRANIIKTIEINKNFSSNIQIKPIVQNSYYITSIPAEGILINKPGKYTFQNDINWYSKYENIAVIIQSNDVEINLNNKKLVNINNKPNIKSVGIQCIGGYNNINISNGTISNMSYYGIQIEISTNVKISNITIKGINLQDLQTRLITPSSIFVSKSILVNIDSCTISDVKVKTDSLAGIQLSECIDGSITNSNIVNMINLDGAIQGFSLILSENILMSKCVSRNFQSFFAGNILTSGHTVLGFCPIFCSNTIFKDCKASKLIGTCDDCHGISVFLDINSLVDNFHASDIFDGVSQSNSGAKATGIEVYGIDVIVKNSSASNIIAINPQDKQSTGFSAAGLNIRFENCTSSNVKVVDSNRKINPSLGNGCGFGWAPDPRPEFRIINAVNILYLNCLAIKCSIGFDTFNHINSVWENAKCKCCNICVKKNNGPRILSCNPCSECNPPIVITIKNSASNNKFITNWLSYDKILFCLKVCLLFALFFVKKI